MIHFTNIMIVKIVFLKWSYLRYAQIVPHVLSHAKQKFECGKVLQAYASPVIYFATHCKRDCKSRGYMCVCFLLCN